MDKYLIIMSIGWFLVGTITGILGVVVWANIAHARDVKKARKLREKQKTVWDINVPGVG